MFAIRAEDYSGKRPRCRAKSEHFLSGRNLVHVDRNLLALEVAYCQELTVWTEGHALPEPTCLDFQCSDILIRRRVPDFEDSIEPREGTDALLIGAEEDVIRMVPQSAK